MSVETANPDSAVPEDSRTRLRAMQEARAILSEHFEAGFLVVTHCEEGVTRFGKTEWGNRFAVSALAHDFADGDLEPMLDEAEEEEA